MLMKRVKEKKRQKSIALASFEHVRRHTRKNNATHQRPLLPNAPYAILSTETQKRLS